MKVQKKVSSKDHSSFAIEHRNIGGEQYSDIKTGTSTMYCSKDESTLKIELKASMLQEDTL